MNVKDASLKNIGNAIKNAASDLLTNNDFISRTIGMTASYDDIMFIVQSLGREPISLLGKDYPFIFDHVRRNFQQGVSIPSMMYGGGEYGCPKFTFYKDPPTVRFADPYQDPLNLLDRWTPNMTFETTLSEQVGKFYAESNDGENNNKTISHAVSNMGVGHERYSTSFDNVATCDLIKKTNDNFKYGKYKTLVARFHTNSMDSRDPEDTTQTAFTNKYGMSHGRNLLKIEPDSPNGYNNPYCRVWTYHHQYHRIADAIRPFGDINSEERYEKRELGNKYGKGGFRTVGDEHFDGGSKRLDKHGVLNYENGFVNIAPTAKIKDYFDGKADDEKAVSTKKCMFSIENLAWRDTNVNNKEYDANGLSPEQRGPLGGRIMWFPPYDLTFSEDVSVDWNGNKFIGRGEQIYTYTNTDRRGNLSFTLIIDHPSILDYWTGHQRNDQSNMGQSLIGGNDGGVDEIWNQENTLLRFFAGCQVLTAKPQEFSHTAIPKDEEADKGDPTPEPDVPAPDETVTKTHKKIQVLLFYPNNYSGKDDGSNSVNPVWYLMNGVGTQKYINDSTKYAEDIPTTLSSKPKVVYGETPMDFNGGYETSPSDLAMVGGISLTIANLNEDHSDIVKSYADTTSKERKGQYLTGPSGTIFKATYGSTNYDLAKIVGSKAMGLGSAYDNNLSGKDHLWYRKRYYYRVDKEYENQDFSNTDSYLDVGSCALNSTGYTSARNVKEFEIEKESDTFKLVSFKDLFVALEESNKAVDAANEDKVKEIKKILTDKDRYEITSLKYFGHASYQGRKNSNNDLAKNRANTLKKWLEGFDVFKGVKAEQPIIKNQSEKPVINVGGNSEINTKLWRSASVIIEYDELSVSNAVETKSVAQTDANGNAVKDKNTQQVLKQVDKVEIPNGKQSPNWSNVNNPYMANDPTNSLLSDNRLDPLTGKLISKEEYNTMNGKSNDTTSEAKGKDDNKQEKNETVKRYDNEGEFFELLDREAPFLHHLITEKIRYFDPAYHSISPEGFNSRLTFLHQCTRQGATIEAGSSNEYTAYNLAFGRPPICVLRLGDFYYTKIIINTLSIQYESPQWDLNPEGIGVMPMFAKINIGFTFLGGSDLAGPIARLQNAVSFNYYANTSVYDDRAEMVEYDDDGSGKVKKFKGWIYQPKKKKRKGYVDKDEDLRWLEGFYNNVNVSNSEKMQSDDRIKNYDNNFK